MAFKFGRSVSARSRDTDQLTLSGPGSLSDRVANWSKLPFSIITIIAPWSIGVRSIVLDRVVRENGRKSFEPHPNKGNVLKHLISTFETV